MALTLLTLMVTVSGKPNPTNPTYPTNPTNPTTKYRCEFVNLNCIYTLIIIINENHCFYSWKCLQNGV